MEKNNKHIINHTATILDAASKLESLSGETLTLFVCNVKKIIGTLTDGDIRRGLLKGLTLESKVTDCMSTNFSFLYSNQINVDQIKKIRQQKIELLPVINKKGEIEKIIDLLKLKSVIPIDCLIMAGGKGERLRPLTNNVPKPMLKVGDKPILEHNIDNLIKFGIENIYISINYLGDQIKDYFRDGSQKGINIKYIEEENFLGTAGSLKLVKDYNFNHILVMNGDLFTDIDFEDLYIKTLSSKADIGIASIPYTINVPYAIFKCDEDRITSLKEKPSETYYANAGIYILKKNIIDIIPENKFYDITQLIEDVLNSGGNIIKNMINGYWIDIGNPDDYKKAQLFLDNNINE